MPNTGKTTLLSLIIYNIKHWNHMSIQNKFAKRKPPLPLLHGEFSLTEHAPFARLGRGKPSTSSVFAKRCFRFAMLNLPENISQSAQLPTISLVSLASFLPASASDYSSGKSATTPTRSLFLFPNCCQMTYFCVFPNSEKPNSSPKQRAAHMLIYTTKPPNSRPLCCAGHKIHM